MKKLFLASFALTVFALSAIIFQMASCKKSHAQSECPPAVYSISGLWEGTYQTDQVSHAPTYASMTIYPDGTFIKRNKVVGSNSGDYGLTRGVWTLNGNILSYRDTTIVYSGGYVVEKGTLTFSNSGTLSNGTWQNIYGQTYTGTFSVMKRIN